MKTVSQMFTVCFLVVAPFVHAADAEIHINFAQSALEGFQGLGAYVQDKNIQKQIDKFVDVHEARMVEALEWNGQKAFMVEVRIQSNNVGAEKLLGVPIILGSGTKPEIVLLSSYRGQRLKEEPSENFQESAEKSHFLWLKYKKGFLFSKARLERGVISPEGASVLKRHVGAALNDIAFADAQEIAGEAERLQALVGHYKEVAKDAAKASQLAQRLEEMKAHQKQLDTIINRLTQALEQEARAAKLVQSFAALQSVLTVANMASQFQSALAKKPKATTSEGIIAEAKSQQVQASNEAKQLQTDRARVAGNGEKIEYEVRATIKSEGAPDLSFHERGIFIRRLSHDFKPPPLN